MATLAVQVGMWDEEDAANWLLSGFSGEPREDATRILERVMMFKSALRATDTAATE